MLSTHKKPIRVGFDFDGVLFYNPTRILRPLTSWLQRKLLAQYQKEFYIPKHPLLQKIFSYLHKTSFAPNIGFAKFIKLSHDPQYEVYVITARLSFIKENLQKLLKKYNARVAGIYQNINDEQPHHFKERLLKQLKLDYFVEDNWDIVRHLNSYTKTRIIWVYNILDRWFIPYKTRVPNIGEAVKKITALSKNKK